MIVVSTVSAEDTDRDTIEGIIGVPTQAKLLLDNTLLRVIQILCVRYRALFQFKEALH